jgi:site-specific recombinase XerD
LLEPDTFRALLLLLYGAGLRIGEALSLTLADADLSAALITVRDTKFYKTRIVALGPELNREMSQYQRSREQAGHSRSNNTPFFVAHNGTALRIHVIREAFQRLRVHAGVCRTDGGHYQPRLHDLRHTFAVDRLTSWYREGKNVQKLLPQLSTYMGHISISSTQVYLTLTPELLREASMRFAQYALKEGGHD